MTGDKRRRSDMTGWVSKDEEVRRGDEAVAGDVWTQLLDSLHSPTTKDGNNCKTFVV